MRLLCIGTGTAAPEPDRVAAGFWLECGPARILFDCGPGVVQSMARWGAPWTTLTHLALTHFHTDHIGDVAFLLFALRWGASPARAEPLTVVGPPGTRRLFRRLASAFGEHVTRPGFALQFEELNGGELALPGGAHLRARPTGHTSAALAYRVDAAEGTFGYTGDTGDSDELAAFLTGVDLLLTECSRPDREPLPEHLTPAGVARLARLALPRRTLVTHVYPQLARAEIPALVAAAGWNGPLSVVADGEEYRPG